MSEHPEKSLKNERGADGQKKMKEKRKKEGAAGLAATNPLAPKKYL